MRSKRTFITNRKQVAQSSPSYNIIERASLPPLNICTKNIMKLSRPVFMRKYSLGFIQSSWTSLFIQLVFLQRRYMWQVNRIMGKVSIQRNTKTLPSTELSSSQRLTIPPQKKKMPFFQEGNLQPVGPNEKGTPQKKERMKGTENHSTIEAQTKKIRGPLFFINCRWVFSRTCLMQRVMQTANQQDSCIGLKLQSSRID